ADVGDRRVAANSPLHLGRADVDPAGDHEVAPAVDHDQVAVGGEGADVAGAEAAVGQEGGGGGAGIQPVGAHDRRRAQEDLPVAGQGHLDPRQGVPVVHDAAPGLGQAVGGDDVGQFADVVGHRATAHQDPPEA